MQTVDPKQASGKPHTLWVEFAKFYENADQIEDVSKQATFSPFSFSFLSFLVLCVSNLLINTVGLNKMASAILYQDYKT